MVNSYKLLNNKIKIVFNLIDCKNNVKVRGDLYA